MTNPLKYLFLIGAAVCAASGMIAMMTTGAVWEWVSWLIWIPSFLLLSFVIEDYGLGPAVTLWSAGSAWLIMLYVALYGTAWGELLNETQWIALGITTIGLIGLAVSKPAVA